MLVPWFQEIVNTQKRWDAGKARANWCAASQVDKDATCTSAGIGLTAGCNLHNCN